MCVVVMRVWPRGNATAGAPLTPGPVTSLLPTGLPVMVYSGINDFVCSWMSSRQWLDSLSWSKQLAWIR